ncbi:short-chain dehydrogenase/reductase SDR [Panaeolus papilionaceus]|nr:short-chain dehydrogenase/reductase SDR [Panaeolus papilionaceus]
MSNLKKLIVVAGVGNGTGVGGLTAKVFAQKGYYVAVLSRGVEKVSAVAEEINAAQQQSDRAVAFPLDSYSAQDITASWAAINARFPRSEYRLDTAVYNASHGVWKPFLEITDQDLQDCLENSVAGAFAFARGAILNFKENEIDDLGKRGTLIFTGATASVRGNVTTSAFSASKHGLRGLSQSLAKEFGKQNIHVAHAIIDGGILVDWLRKLRDEAWAANENGRLKPESIGNAYYYLSQQDRSAWTWELDLRPAHEKW